MSLSKVRQLERELLEETGRRLLPLGFSSRPKGQTFFRPLDGGLVAAHLTFIEREHDFDVTVDVAIRFHAVEELVNRTNRFLSAKEKAETFTLGAELGNLEHGRPYRNKVANVADVAVVAERIAHTFARVGLPYIELYSSPEAACAILSRDDREAWVHSPIHAERAKRACALLVVLNRYSEIQALGAEKMAFLESLQDPGAISFSRFLADLGR